MEGDIRSLHEKLRFLEQQLQDGLSISKEKQGQANKDSTEPTRKTAIPRLNYVHSWDAFQSCLHHDNPSAIDVLHSELDTVKNTPSCPGQQPLPARIGINSKIVLEVLDKIHGTRISTGDGPVIMVSPYKSLVFYDDKIRKWTSYLEGSNENPLLADLPAQDSVPQQKSEALAHLKCLVQFMDERLVTRLLYLNSPECREVVSSDMWHLFRPGVAIVDEHLQQAYCVSNLMGTNPSLGPYPDQSLVIECIRINLDGQKLGPELHRFVIPEFEDTRNITSFEAFPIRFARDGLEEFLVSRGKSFIQLTGIKPVHYTGTTIDNDLEIDSTVIIDVEEACRSKEFPEDWKPRLEQCVGYSHANGFHGEEHGGDMAHRSHPFEHHVHDDTYVDMIQSQDFIRK